MSSRARLLGFLFVGTIVLQNYESQVSHVPAAQVALWSLHEWVGSIIHVVIAGFIAWKAYLADSGSTLAAPRSPLDSPEVKPA